MGNAFSPATIGAALYPVAPYMVPMRLTTIHLAPCQLLLCSFSRRTMMLILLSSINVGTCDFIMAEPQEEVPSVAVPNTGYASPEQFVDALPFTPCPAGVTCETTKCAITDGVEKCCDCFVWEATGFCGSKGWKPRSTGDCSFATRASSSA